MPDRTPTQTKNLDGYGFAELPWSRPNDLLAAGPEGRTTFTLSTTRPDGKPHATGVGVRWHDGDLYFNSGPGTRKAKNLAVDPAAVLSVSLPGLDLVLQGEAKKVDDPKVMEAVAARFRAGGWPVEVKDGRLTAPFSAPSAGPPPWDFYRFRFRTVFGVATAEPYGATRWHFG
jgi:nitroimidazol reductase NimA-like FMN-containing flavoprotein (pyridoxamine 5'-phosphate oxidase superfamily)